MAENTTSIIQSLSDSELNRMDSPKIVTGSRRKRSNSESYASAFQEALRLEPSAKNNDSISAVKTVSDHKSFESVLSSQRSIPIPRKRTVGDINDKRGISVNDVSKLHQQNSATEEERKSTPENKSSLQNEESVKGKSADSQVLVTTVHLEDDDKRQAADDSSNPQTSSEEVPAKGMSLDEEQVVLSEIAKGEAKAKISSPYQVLEQAKANAICLGDNILGEPRCLALKKCTTDGDDDFELDFEMTAVIEDEDDELLTEQISETTKKKTNIGPDPNDMFLDDGTDIQNVPKADLDSPKKGNKSWEYPSLEKEEGELTPDLYSSTHSDVAESKDTSSKKPTMKESNLEFFNKVNRCFRHLEKEFSNMHIPRRSTRLVEYLRNTLCVVERMKRKLSVLVSSASSSSGRDSHGKVLSSHRNKASAKGSNQSSRNSRTSKEREHKSDNGATKSEGWYKSQDIKSSNNPDPRRLDDVKTSHTNKYIEEHRKSQTLSEDLITKQRESKAKMEHLRRTPTSFGYSKKEKQRVQSLFKRQMDLITEQIKKHNDQGKGQTTKSGGSGTKLMPRSRRNNQSRLSLDHLETLDDMERFLHLLKLKKGQKITPSDWLRDYQTKQVLKFTTKKENPVSQTRTLPVLLTGAKEDERCIPTQAVKTGDISLQANTREENVPNEEKQAGNPDKIHQQKRKPEKEGHELDGILDEQSGKCNSNNSLNAREFSKSNSSKRLSSREQKDGKDKIRSGKIDNVSKEPCVEGIEFRRGENAPSPREVIDSSLVKRNSKEMGRGELHFHSRASDFERDPREIFPENSAKRRRKKNSEPKSSESDSDSRRDQILKKRKRNESEGDSRCKLSPRERKKDIISGGKSRKRNRSGSETVIDGFDEKLPEELKTKNIFIVSDKKLPILDNHFCVKVKGNQIYLKKVGKIRSGRRHRNREQRNSHQKSETVREGKKHKRMDREVLSDSGPTLQEMEDFLEQLRTKKIPKEKQHDTPLPSQQSREMKFMARIQAKRKAKLMACVSATPNITEKETKFLKDLEYRSKNPCDSPETESKKQKLMEKIRAETDNIVLSQKQSASLEDDPLNDVKTFLNMIKEAESANDDKAKQFYVSFSLKRSDVKQLENITTGKASALSEESQRFLNSVRAKMRAKKAPVLLINEDSKQKDS